MMSELLDIYKHHMPNWCSGHHIMFHTWSPHHSAHVWECLMNKSCYPLPYKECEQREKACVSEAQPSLTNARPKEKRGESKGKRMHVKVEVYMTHIPVVSLSFNFMTSTLHKLVNTSYHITHPHTHTHTHPHTSYHTHTLVGLSNVLHW